MQVKILAARDDGTVVAMADRKPDSMTVVLTRRRSAPTWSRGGQDAGRSIAASLSVDASKSMGDGAIGQDDIDLWFVNALGTMPARAGPDVRQLSAGPRAWSMRSSI